MYRISLHACYVTIIIIKKKMGSFRVRRFTCHRFYLTTNRGPFITIRLIGSPLFFKYFTNGQYTTLDSNVIRFKFSLYKYRSKWNIRGLFNRNNFRGCNTFFIQWINKTHCSTYVLIPAGKFLAEPFANSKLNIQIEPPCF